MQTEKSDIKKLLFLLTASCNNLLSALYVTWVPRNRATSMIEALTHYNEYKFHLVEYRKGAEWGLAERGALKYWDHNEIERLMARYEKAVSEVGDALGVRTGENYMSYVLRVIEKIDEHLASITAQNVN